MERWRQASQEADESPIDFQGAARLQLEYQDEMCCLGGTVYAYADGCWLPIGQQLLRQRVLRMLRRFQGPRPPCAFLYGSNKQVLNTLATFKTLMGPGPLASADQLRVIVFSNGTYDLGRGELGVHDPTRSSSRVHCFAEAGG